MSASRRFLGALGALAIGACAGPTKGGGEASAAAAASSLATSSAAPRESAAPSAAAVPAPSASDSASAKSGPPSFPAETSEIRVTWLLHPVRFEGAVPAMHVDLVAQGGGVMHTVPIDALYTVTFLMDMQPICQPRRSAYAPGALAELWLNGGGVVWYSVERGAGGALQVFESSQADGLCGEVAGRHLACPVSRKLLATLDAPASARIVERFRSVAREILPDVRPGRIREEPFTCASH